MNAKAAWTALHAHGARLQDQHLRDLFAQDEDRFSRFCFSLEDLTLDLSKEKIDQAALGALMDLATATGLVDRRQAMADGHRINSTEDRAVLHMALRGSVTPPANVEVAETQDQFLSFAQKVRGSPDQFTDVLNIGIGGSDLGPAMAAIALRPDWDGPRPHFLSNVDGAHFRDLAKDLDPAKTLVVISSKTFTTRETMANAALARSWLGADRAGQMVAVSTNLDACAQFGIPADQIFGFWDWVGGRYSMWSAIGLTLAIAIGPDKFRAMLTGARAMDEHFLNAPIDKNLPILMGLIGIWRRNVMGWPATALIPYDQRLSRFPAYVQQLDMESNGKRVTLTGADLTEASGPLIFGEPGTNAQHSFFQLLHQGTDIVPVDFIAAAKPRDADADHHKLLLANCFAQSQALAFGRSAEETERDLAGGDPSLLAHRTFPGDRPSTTILHRELDAFALGRLVALFEHKVFTQGAILGLNSFDQWGVELGKACAQKLEDALFSGSAPDADSSTSGLIAKVRTLSKD